MRPTRASHSTRPATNLRGLLGALLALFGGAACPSAPPANDDDSATPADDDDTTPPPVLGAVLGVVNLTNVRRPGGSDYVDLSGAFGPFTAIDTEMIAPSAFLGQWGYEAPRWRSDLGAWPLPALGESVVLDLLAYTPWDPRALSWWDAGDRIETGPYQSLRLAEDTLIAYQVEDPLVPGGAAWPSGGTVSFGTSGGVDIVGWAAPTGSPVPAEVGLTDPPAGGSLVTPAAHDLPVRWTPKSDGATVTVVLLQGLGLAYIAQVADTGEHIIPASVLHDELGPGVMELVVGRSLESRLAHPQGDVLLRVRVEERASVTLEPDLVLSPAYAAPGTTTTVELGWFTGSVTAATILDLGPDIEVLSVTPTPGEPERGTATVQVDALAALGPRPVTITTGSDSWTAADAFTVMNLLPSNDCADALALPPLVEGTFYSTTVGLTNSMSTGWACIDWSLNAADATYALPLLAGQTVRITTTAPAPADVALVLLTTCGDPASAVACADQGYEGDAEALDYTALQDETIYVVIDGYTLSGVGAPSSPFELIVQLAAPPSPIAPPWIVPGDVATLVVTADAAWDAGLDENDVDLGAGLVAQAVGVGGVPTELSVTTSAAGDAAPGPRTVLITNGAGGDVVLPDALFVTEWPANDTCEEADAYGPIAAGATPEIGWAPGVSDTISETGCFSWLSVGPEVLFALDLVVGERLSVSVTSAEDTQLYLLADCEDPLTSCVAAASSDVGLAGEGEAFSDWEVPATGRYTLVLDTYLPPFDPVFSYTLGIEVE